MRSITRGRGSRLLAWPTLCLCLAFPGAAVGQDSPADAPPPVPEYHLKLAYLTQLPKFVTWPSGSGPEPGAPFIIGVMDAAPLRDALPLLQRARARGHRFELITIDSPRDLDRCHLAFLNSLSVSRNADLAAQTRGRPVLTVGENERFARNGGTVGIVHRDGRLALFINLPAARAAGLQIGAQLLELATVIN